MIRSKKDMAIGILILIPSFIALMIFVYGFILWSLRTSMSKWDGILPDFTFVGLKNFISLFTKTRFIIDIWNTLFFTILFISFCVFLGFFLAVLLEKITKGITIFRNIFLFPMAISFVVTGVVWRWIFSPTVGVNALLAKIGIPFTWGWFTDASSYFNFHVALIPVVIAAGWQLTGYTMAMFLAGIHGIPEEVIESAKIDGAHDVQILFHIIIPYLRPILLAAMIVLGHVSLKIFDLVYTMTGKGPAFATDFPSIFMFETTFRGNHYSEGASISIIMLIMVALVIVPYLYSVFKKEKS
jgi:glucose/mannose transport system permease protein